MSPDPRAADRAARRTAQLVFDRPVVLEAGAGTGKTTALVGRLLAWALGVGWEETALARAGADDETIAGALLDGVVAITFTEAAAAEMASRAQRELARLADLGDPPAWLEAEAVPADPASRARRARALLASIDRLRVQTIHSFAFALLRGHGLEAGLHPDLAVDSDGSGLREIVIEVLAEQLPPRYRAADPALLRLAREGLGPEALRALLVELNQAGVGAEALARDPWTPGAIGAAFDALSVPVRDIAGRLAGARFPKAKNSQALADELPGLLARLDEAPRTRAGLEATRVELDRLLSPGARTRIAEWGRGKLNQGELDHLADPAGAARSARSLRTALELFQSIDPDRLDAARAALAPLAAEVDRRMRARGLATFADLLRLAVEVVSLPRVAREIRRGIRQLLIDELQDTDELQCELVERLALDGPRDERPGLFLVGDPKQSIYGWRRARLANYFGFVDRALAGERPARLSLNFRSAAGVLEEVRRAVEPVMAAESDVAAPFAALHATGDRIEAPGEIEFWVSWDAESAKPLASGESARREAAAIAADLARRIARGALEPRDAAILLRGSSQFERLLDALRERGVPYAVEKDRSYFRRRETIDAAALVRAVLDPADRPALVAWLRSPWIGVPDAALEPLLRERLPERLAVLGGEDPAALAEAEAAIARAAATTPDADPGLAPLAGWPTALSVAVRALAERRAAFAREDADAWTDGLRRAFLPDLTAAARFQGRYRLANLDRFFRELAERLAGAEPLERLLADLRAAARERPDEPESRPLEGAGNAVRVMTIHSAKGLEFEEVYLASVHHEPRGAGPAPAVEAERVDRRWELRLFGTATPGFAPAADLAARIRAAEQVRLLYVALTRARRRLVVSGALPGAPGEADPERARSLAHLLAPRLPRTDLAAILATAGDAGWIDPHGVRWKLLTPAAPAESVAAPEPHPQAMPPAADPDAALARVVAERARARHRAARARLARVTELAELEAETADLDEASRPLAVDRTRAVALARGSALHRALERVALAASDPAGWRARVRAGFELELGAAGATELAALDRDLDRLATSGLFARLGELESRIVARELPVVLAAADDAAGPLDAITGAVDLVYRDPDDRLVVADFKSDALDERGDADAIRRYGPQLRAYGRALAAALGLDLAPRLELWLLALDRAVEVPSEPSAR